MLLTLLWILGAEDKVQLIMQVSGFPVIAACSFLSGPEKIAPSATMGPPTSNAPWGFHQLHNLARSHPMD